jgi:hypothetical protein
MGHGLAQLVVAMPHERKGRGFDSRWYHLNSGRTVSQSVTEMSTVEPWIASIIRSRNVLLIQNTRTSK